MKKVRAHLLILLLLLVLPVTPSCGGRNRQLKSLTIVGQGGSSTETIVNATGTFDKSPYTQTPLPASWYLLGPGLDPPGSNYQLTSQSFVLPCGGYTAIAVAPADPRAPSSGSIPDQVFQDLVITHTKSSEGGFVAAVMVGLVMC